MDDRRAARGRWSCSDGRMPRPSQARAPREPSAVRGPQSAIHNPYARNPSSGDRDVLVQVDVLNRVQQPDAFLDRALEGLAAGDEAHAAGALVDDGRLHSLFEIALAGGCATRIDQTGAAHVAVGDLVARQVDRMRARQIRVDLLARLAEVQGGVAAVGLRKFLLDDVGFDRYTRQ